MPFDLEPIHFLFERRSPLATAIFQLFTFIGELEGYILVVAFVYAAYDKSLAFRLAVLALLTMSLNHVLKTLIANPRPFIAEGSYAEKWAVSDARAAELAAEYSTPSGHAMSGGVFYSYLYAKTTKRAVRLAAVSIILLTGLSRPYLGVHYIEDILLGWALAIPIAILALRFGDQVGAAWNRRPLVQRAAFVVAISLFVVLVTGPLYESVPHGQPLPFVNYLGLLAGITIAYPLEIRWVDFDPRSSSAFHKAARVGISAALVLGTLFALDGLFGMIAGDTSWLGIFLRFLRYALAGIMGILLAPLLFVWTGLADRRGSAASG